MSTAPRNKHVKRKHKRKYEMKRARREDETVLDTNIVNIQNELVKRYQIKREALSLYLA